MLVLLCFLLCLNFSCFLYVLGTWLSNDSCTSSCILFILPGTDLNLPGFLWGRPHIYYFALCKNCKVVYCVSLFCDWVYASKISSL